MPGFGDAEEGLRALLEVIPDTMERQGRAGRRARERSGLTPRGGP